MSFIEAINRTSTVVQIFIRNLRDTPHFRFRFDEFFEEKLRVLCMMITAVLPFHPLHDGKAWYDP